MALDLADKSGNGNTLTNKNGVTDVTASPPFSPDSDMGGFASASNQWLVADDSASLSITGNLTIEAWIKPASISAVQTIAGKWNTVGNNRSYMFRLLSDNTLQLRTDTNGSTNSSAGTTDTVTSTTTWTHVAVTYNASAGTCQFYINGSASQAGSGLQTSLYDSTARFGIGGEDQGTDTPVNPFNGQIDEIRVYTVARTSGQISGDYKKELSVFTNMAAYWPLNSIPSPALSSALWFAQA